MKRRGNPFNFLGFATDVWVEPMSIDPVLLQRSLDMASDVALIYDRLLRLVYVNRAAAALLRVAPEAAIGKTNTQVLGDAAALFDPHLERAFRTKEKVVAEQTVPLGDETVLFETVYTPVLGDHGNPQFVLIISRNVSGLRT